MTRTILIVESDGEQGDAIAVICREGSFGVDVVAHELALAHLSKHAKDYCALVVRVSHEPSTLSSADRMGEFVLRYVAHAMPEMLVRTVVLTDVEEDIQRSFPPVHCVLAGPFDGDELLNRLTACCNALSSSTALSPE